MKKHQLLDLLAKLSVLVVVCTNHVHAADVARDILMGVVKTTTVSSSLHYQATWKLRQYGDDGETSDSTATYEEWTDGQAFRVIGKVDSGQTNGPEIFEVAYDGKTYQMILPRTEGQSDFLTHTTNFVKADVMLRPNPILLPVEFLSRFSDQCYPCWIQVSDLADSSRVSAIAAASQIDGDKAGLQVIRSPGGILYGVPYEYFTYINVRTQRPERIEKVGPNGRLLGLTKLTYQELKSQLVPLSAELVMYGPSGKIFGEMRVRVDKISFSEPLPLGIFSLDKEKAKTIWDEDAKVFTRTRSGYVGPAMKRSETARKVVVVLVISIALAGPILWIMRMWKVRAQ